ncbi:lysophospholipid acyltransferase family protein [Modestobacter roseus]|uniref:1-acyl-sn-glycerol-3-phosphate acyltransferase n=1 Tax=Modestobacter roseus TaxID=1181884 RepID=A0A562IW67_9ACTN|nr:lysophospholipid acyltransferase family protein [Modestobacter roseus]MQA35791.1 1-acyl-sn-glycerol-3-phosphate acyltransferase [Modestobacter roseus]TWH75142.1 1-acyl-sn-glycerol-3-phosphate acyltransferase [Modestobacter roseus]
MDAYPVVRALARPLVLGMFRPRVEGIEHLPATGPVILAGNHPSTLDQFFPPLLTRRRVTYLAKNEFFTRPGLSGRALRWLMESIGMVPLDRGGANAADAALRRGGQVLGEGGLLGIYPEGTRSPDGRLHRGKTGVARLALATGAPVVPVAVIGSYALYPAGARWPRPGRVTVRFGEPMDFSAEPADDPAVLRRITDQVMAELQRLSGDEYVDRYAADVKAEIRGRAA